MTSQSLQYGGIHDSHFKYIQTTIISLFLGWFWKVLHQNKWLVKHFTPRLYSQLILCTPLKERICSHWEHMPKDRFSHGAAHISFVLEKRSLYNAVASASDCRSRGCRFESQLGHITLERLIMKTFLWSFSPFRWFKKGSCQLLVKVCTSTC